jgi:hypothetical protein
MTLFEILLCVLIYILMGILVKEMWELCTVPYEWRHSVWIGALWPVTVPLIILWFVITMVIVIIDLVVEAVREVFFKKKSTEVESEID